MPAPRPTRSTALRLAALTVVAAAAIPAATAAAHPSARNAGGFHPVVVASGLDNPRQLALGPDGGLYVAEAGSGGPNCVGTGADQSCIGTTGAIGFIGKPRSAANAIVTHLVTGLTSAAGSDGTFAVGGDGIALNHAGRLYIQMTYAPPDLGPIPNADQLGKLLEYNRTTAKLRTVADISAYELAHDPDGLGPDTDPYAVLAMPDGSKLVADAAGNDVLRVRNGKVSLWHVFANLPSGEQWVPTSLARDADGHVYVGGLAGETPGKARVVEFSASGHRVRTIGGFTTVTGVAVDASGNLWVSELFWNLGDPSSPDFDPSTVGRVTKVAPNGQRTHYAVPLPAGIVVDRAGFVYVSAWSIAPGAGAFGNPDWAGQIWRFRG
jgi:hypothetical protein